MKKATIKYYLKKAMDNKTSNLVGYPNVNEIEKEEFTMKKNFKKFLIPTSLVATLCACSCFLIAVVINNKADTLVSLDVNPAIQLELNKSEKVIKVDAKNEDAKTIVGDMDLKNVDADVAVNALIGSMLKEGYLKENSKENNVLLNVSNKDEAKSKEIKDKLAKSIKDTMHTNNSNVTILSSNENPTQDEKDLADQYQISVGRASFINKLIQKDPNLSFEQLSQMSIKDMVQYLDKSNIDYDDIVEKDDDDDDIDDLIDQEEDLQDQIKDEKEKKEEALEKEQEKTKEENEKKQEALEKEQDKIKEENEKKQEALKKEQERIEEENEKKQEALKEQQEKEAEKRKKEQEALKEQQEKAQEELEKSQENSNEED